MDLEGERTGAEVELASFESFKGALDTALFYGDAELVVVDLTEARAGGRLVAFPTDDPERTAGRVESLDGIPMTEIVISPAVEGEAADWAAEQVSRITEMLDPGPRPGF